MKKIFLVFFIFFLGCKYQQTIILDNKIISQNIKKIETPVKCIVYEKNKKHTLYGKLNINKNYLKLKLFSNLNYYRINFLFKNQKFNLKVNNKRTDLVLDSFLKKNFYKFIKLVFLGEITKNFELIKIDKNVKILFNKKLNTKLFLKENKIFKILYKNIIIRIEKYVSYNNFFVPQKLVFERNETKIKFFISNSKLYIE